MLIMVSTILCLNSELIDLGWDLLQVQSETPHAEKLQDGATQSARPHSQNIACLAISQDVNQMDWLWLSDEDVLMLVPALVSIPIPSEPQRSSAAALLQVQFMGYWFHTPISFFTPFKVLSHCLFFLPYH